MNTFNQLVQAAQSLEHTEILGREEPPTSEEMAEFVTANKPHLDAAREALRGEFHAEVVYVEDMFDKHMDEIVPLRDLARAFCLELTVAEREGRLADAVESGVNALDLAGAVRRGGFIIDMFIAGAISGFGVDALRRIRHRLGIDELRLLLRELQRVESQREAFASIAARDEQWERRFPQEEESEPFTMEWPEPEDDEEELDEETKQAILELITESASRPREEQTQDFLDSDHRELAFLRLLTVDSALLAFQATLGALPEELDALVPKFLRAVPLDRYIDEPFHFRRDGDDVVLYSVGPSRTSHGGRMGSWDEVMSGEADFFLDTSD